MQLIKLSRMVVVFFLLSGCSTMQLYYVKNANMVSLPESSKKAFNRDRPESARLLLNGHYVKSGGGLVFLFRKFDRGGIFTVDDETYEKLTIEVQNYTLGEPIALDSPDIRFYYSSGSSGFVYKGHGVYSASGSGSVVVKRVEKKNGYLTCLLGSEFPILLWARRPTLEPIKYSYCLTYKILL